MLGVTLEQIKRGYGFLSKKAHRAFDKGKYYNCISCIKRCALLAYMFNWIYADYELEDLIRKISEKKLKPVKVNNPNDSRVVWIDQFPTDKHGLSTQYTDAFIHLNKEILFIMLDGSKIDTCPEILKKLRNKSGNVIEIISPKDNSFERLQNIIDKIREFRPSQIFLHFMPWTVEGLLIIDNIKGIPKYNFNGTDHAFWLGASFLDYNLEFRDYGATVSIEKRGLTADKLIVFPYYPVINEANPFEGFPAEIKSDDVIIFTGGSPYKYKGKDDIFFRLLDIVLSISPKVKVLIAGFNSDSFIEKRLNQLQGRDRVMIIGNRRDIDKVFENCDIYMGSYPFGGGLMSCYAANLAKPIIAYAEPSDIGNHLEALVNIFSDGYHTSESLDEFREYALKLITDKDFRLREGERLREGAMTKDKFEGLLVEICENSRSPLQYKLVKIDYNSFCKDYILRENKEPQRLFFTLIRLFKLNIFRFFPEFILWIPYFSMIFIKKIIFRLLCYKFK